MSGITIGVIGGTGLGQLLQGIEGHRHEVDTPFGKPSDAIIESQWEGVRVLMLSRHGAGHLLSPTQVPARANIFALKQLGCTHLLASGAVGSLRQEFKPKDLVIPDQIIDKTHRRPATFYESAAVHVEFAEPFCPVLRRILMEEGAGTPGTAAEGQAPSPFSIHQRGCYVCMEGPAFSTRAESLMHRLWGGDLIGMTAMPEAKLAREAELPYALVALVTDYDSWRQKPPVAAQGGQTAPPTPAPEPIDAGALLAEIRGNLQSASASAMELIRKTIRRIAADPSIVADCPASSALKLAIWSDKARIPAEEVSKLSPLWGMYFR